MSELGEINRDGAVPQKNSGRGKTEKGDAILGSFLIDYKEYDETFGVSRKVWAKLHSDSWQTSKLPCLRIVLGEKNNTHKLRLWVFNDEIGREMIDLWEEKYGKIDEQ